jgi:hypothetical protein
VRLLVALACADSLRRCGAAPSQANPAGLAILVACGLWAYFEYKRPGGKLNPNAAQYKLQQDLEARRKRASEMVRLS